MPGKNFSLIAKGQNFRYRADLNIYFSIGLLLVNEGWVVFFTTLHQCRDHKVFYLYLIQYYYNLFLILFILFLFLKLSIILLSKSRRIEFSIFVCNFIFSTFLLIYNKLLKFLGICLYQDQRQ